MKDLENFGKTSPTGLSSETKTKQTKREDKQQQKAEELQTKIEKRKRKELEKLE